MNGFVFGSNVKKLLRISEIIDINMLYIYVNRFYAYFANIALGNNLSWIISNFLKHLLIVTSLTPETDLISVFEIFNAQYCDTKYIIPAEIA